MNSKNQEGSKLYLFSIVIVAVIGGLLFGYDTAVINGAEKGLQAFIFPSTDPHCGEYVPEHWMTRQWISGFDGSAGTAVVTLEDAAVWTDSRYFIAAAGYCKIFFADYCVLVTRCYGQFSAAVECQIAVGEYYAVNAFFAGLRVFLA